MAKKDVQKVANKFLDPQKAVVIEVVLQKSA